MQRNGAFFYASVLLLEYTAQEKPLGQIHTGCEPGNEEEKYELAVSLNCFLLGLLPMEHGSNRGSILAIVLPSIDAATEGNDSQWAYIRAHQGVESCSCSCQLTESSLGNSSLVYVDPNQRHSAVGSVEHNTRRLLSCCRSSRSVL